MTAIPTPSGLVPSTPYTPADILRLARAKIDTPEKWTQGALARGKTRRPCEPMSKVAVCWCSMGAIAAAAGGADRGAYAREILRRATGQHTISAWNDEHDHPAILAAFDRAIQLADHGGQGE